MSEPAPTPTTSERLGVLDGWRALSITLVLIGHWLPMPRAWQLNGAAAASGMALFFVLSGFLITSLLLRDPRPAPFLARRIFRIVPLAWLAMAILAVANRADWNTVVANFLFHSNLGSTPLMRGGEHLWSLCVEVQFYLFCAVLVWLAGRRAIFVLPILGFAVTMLRIADAQPISINTFHRVDEILAGASVAILFATPRVAALRGAFPQWACLASLGLLVLSAHPATGPLQYARPYFAAATIGFSLLAVPAWLERWLTSKPARYVAETSYAVYVLHWMLGATALGGEEASKAVRYALRIPLVIVTFALAHLSTRYFERFFMTMGKRVANRLSAEPRKPTETARPSSGRSPTP